MRYLRLKKIGLFFVFLVLATGLAFGEYYLLTNTANKPQYQLIIVAKQDIPAGAQITLDKLSVARVDIQTPIHAATTRNQILGKYTLYDIKAGEPIIPEHLTDWSIDTLANGMKLTAVRIDPVPYDFINIGDEIELGCVIQDKTLSWRVRVIQVYDANFRDIRSVKEQLQQTNAQQAPALMIGYLAVAGDDATIKTLKSAEKQGTLFVIKEK